MQNVFDMGPIHIFDILGTYCGMHYYDMAFAQVFRDRGLEVQIHSNYVENVKDKAFFPVFFLVVKF